MLLRKPKPPATQRRFTHPWLELVYLCKKIRFWLYTRKDKQHAYRYFSRLQRVLKQVPQEDMAIIRHEGLALIGEMAGDVSMAVVHRRKEIELIERLRREAQLPRYSESTRAYMLRDLDETALHGRREILKSLMKQKAEANSNGAHKTK